MFLLFYDLHCNYICGETFWSVFYNRANLHLFSLRNHDKI